MGLIVFSDSFGKTCPVQSKEIKQDSVFNVSFFPIGKPSDMWCSHMAFNGHGSSSKDKYQICTTLKRIFGSKMQFETYATE